MPSLAELTRAARTLGGSTNHRTSDANLNPLGAFGGGFSGNAYGAWLAGTPMEAALPRSIQDFIQGAFGPLEPIMPQPIDVPTQDGQRPDPRRFQYPVGWNLPVGIPGSEGIKVAPFQVMRSYADRYSVVRSCIRVRRDEILGLDWDITPTEPMEKKMRDDTDSREEWMKRREEALEFWRKPDRAYSGFTQWLAAILEEIFVTDSLTLHLQPPRKNGKGLFNTNLAALELIDGTTIRPLLDVSGGPPRPPAPAYQQYLWGVPRSDLMSIANETDADMMAEDIKEYSTSQILYLPYWKRVWTPYGFSPVEQALVPNAIGLSRQVYFLDYFSEGSLPGAYIVPGPEVASAAQRKQLQDALNAIAGDIGQKFKIIVLPSGSKKEDVKEVKLADGSDTIITELVMMVFAVYSEELSMVPGGKSAGLGGSAHKEGQDDIRRRERTKPLVKWLKDSLMDYVLQEVCGQKDMQFTWTGLDESEDRAAKAASDKVYIDEGVISRDEVRADLSLPPWGLPLTGSPTITTAAGVVPLDPGIPLTVEQGAAPAAPPPGMTPPGLPPKPPGATGAPAGLPPGAQAAPPVPPGKKGKGKGKPPKGVAPDVTPPAAEAPAAEPPEPKIPVKEPLRQGDVPPMTTGRHSDASRQMSQVAEQAGDDKKALHEHNAAQQAAQTAATVRAIDEGDAKEGNPLAAKLARIKEASQRLLEVAGKLG